MQGVLVDSPSAGRDHAIPQGNQRNRQRSALFATSAQWFQKLRRPHGSGDPRGADRRGRPQWLRQVEPAGSPALGHGRKPAHGDARRRHGRRDLCRRGHPGRAQFRRSVDHHRQCRPSGPVRLQRSGPDRDRAADHARCRIGLQGQYQGRAGARRADALCRCLDRRAIARAGAARPDFRTDQRQAQEPPPHSGRGGGHFRPVSAPPRGGTAAAGDRDESDPRR